MSHQLTAVPSISSDPIPAPLDDIKREILGTQLEVALLEARQRDIRLQLQHCRVRRAALGRTYHRLLVQRDLQA